MVFARKHSAISDMTSTPSQNLWFYMEPRKTSSPLIFGHYFGPYPTSIENGVPNDDYYARNYLKLAGESGVHSAYGGLLRNRPYHRSPLGGDWLATDMAQIVDDAVSAGLDGLYCNIMGTGGWNWTNYLKLRDVVVASYPSFKLIPMLDASAMDTETAAQMATMVNEFAGTSHYLDDGRMLVGTFKMEGRTTAHWNSVASSMLATYSKTIAWVGVFNNYPANIANYSSALGSSMYASGNWGPGADPAIATNSTVAPTAASYGHVHHAPWWWQDVRPNQYIFTENRGLECHRVTANRILADSSGLVQVCTWNDHSEGSHFGRSASTGYSLIDLTAYEVSRIRRGGIEPVVLQDTVFLTHRNRTASTTPASGGQTSGFMAQRTWSGSESTLTYDVEVTTFLTAASDVNGVTVTVAGVPTSYTAPAGRYVQRVAAAGGVVSVSVLRGSNTVVSMTSPITIRSQAYQQNMEQYVIGSNRGTPEQFDATQTNTGLTPTYPV